MALVAAAIAVQVCLAQPAEFPGWPREWEGVTLQRAPLGAGDRACIKGFSGESARMVGSDKSYLFRWTSRPSRTLQSVSVCYEQAGYRIDPDRRPPPGPDWTCYLAGKTGERWRLCETVYNQQGKRWATMDKWMEEAINDRLPGPFWSVIVAERAR
ncbi:MAG: hypothetical protein R2748_12470 [Bryobacterales bacterium]